MSATGDYVAAPGQARTRRCCWSGCPRLVPARMWGCGDHWRRLPKPLRDELFRTYRPGQEVDGVVAPAYVKALRAIDQYVAELETA